MKVAAKKKKQARFNHDGSEKAPGEYEALTPIEEKFRARVSITGTAEIQTGNGTE